MKKIIIFSILITLAFGNTAFAKTLSAVDNVDPHKVWTVKFNKPIKDANITVLDSENQERAVVLDIKDNNVLITSLLDYPKGNYTIKVKSAIAKDGSKLKETTDMQFIIRK